jgi:hypothetical protein
MAKHRSYSIEFERQVAQEYIAAQFPVVLARVLQGNLLELFPRLRRSHLIGTIGSWTVWASLFSRTGIGSSLLPISWPRDIALRCGSWWARPCCVVATYGRAKGRRLWELLAVLWVTHEQVSVHAVIQSQSRDIPRAKADVSWQTGRSLAASSRGIKLKRTRNSGYRPDSHRRAS